MKKRILAMLIALTMVVTGLYIPKLEAQEVQAADIIQANTVEEGMLSVKMQASKSYTNEDGDTVIDIRMVSSVNGLGYGSVGFEVWYGDAAVNPTSNNITATFTTQKVLERIKAGVAYNYSPKVIDTSAEYFVTATIEEIKSTNWDKDFYVRAFCTDFETGTVKTYGVGRYFNVTDATATDIINIPIKMASSPTVGTSVDVTVAGEDSKATVEAYIAGYAHLNVKMPAAADVTTSVTANQKADKTNLASASEIVVTSTNESAIYRNLESKLVNTSTGDQTWYTKYSGDEFVIVTLADLYGLPAIVNSSTANMFDGKTIYLVADITANTGKASDWATTAPSLSWTPIGKDTSWDFEGTFDGQGHTISGLYHKSTDLFVGLFGVLDTIGESVVKNFQLVNSYFETQNTITTEAKGIGSVAGQGAGQIESIYSDAILVNKQNNIGGILGNCFQKATLDIRNCWFDGTATGNTCIGGIVGFRHGNALSIAMEDCLVTADLISTLTSGNVMMGGLLGRMTIGTVTSCVAEGTLTTASGVAYVAGLFGHVNTAYGGVEVSNCYNAMTWNEAAVGNYLGSPTLYSHIKQVSSSNLKGIDAYQNTSLDFYNEECNEDGKWAVVKEEVIQLKSFTKEEFLADLSKVEKTIAPCTCWYTANASATTFVISTPEDLCGLASVVNAKTDLFEKDTIKLAADITLNYGVATDWEKGEKLPTNTWTPIGKDTAYNFEGTFDGQGHTISGLYHKSTDLFVGLFGVLDVAGTSTIKNFKLTNSYLETESTVSTEVRGLGSVAGQGAGQIETIYSDAILVNKHNNTGGILGNCFQKATLGISNCWFDGTATGVSWIGGIVGFRHGQALTMTMGDCLVTADLTSTMTSGTALMGGLLGRMTAGTVTSCIADGTLTTATGVTNVSGLFGNLNTAYGSVELSNCYNAMTWNGTMPSNYTGTAATSVSYVVQISKDNLKGTSAYSNTLLGFYDVSDSGCGSAENNWVLIENHIPELKNLTENIYMSDLSSLSSLSRPQ